MKRISILVVGLIASLVLLVSVGSASPGLKLDKQDIGSKQCKADGAKQLVDVHYTVINDADSGFGGNYWANDTLDRHLRIWSQDDGATYCVQLADHGQFVTYAGLSPSGSSTVTAGIKGNIEGGYVTTDIVGTFDASRPTHGNLGTYDLQCDQSGTCTGSTASWHDYFSSISSSNDFAQWGWIYHAGKHGTWLNQDDVAAADSGDIT